MKNIVAIVGLLVAVGFVAAQNPPARNDLNFQQSPAKPTPDWVKIVDHGQYDPRLKGYFAPEGIKIEIVAEAPDVINPVGMTFDADGTLYVLEWVEDPKAANSAKAHDRVHLQGRHETQGPHHAQADQGPRQDARLQRQEGRLRLGQGRPRRRTAVQHPPPRRLDVPQRPGDRAPLQAASQTARGARRKSSPRASAASTTIRSPA